ncbi:hypothetical protein BH11PLA1_BH11PLA1_21570 [soil metagenome]
MPAPDLISNSASLSTESTEPIEPDRFQPLALLLAFLLPGLGHFILGYRARALCIFLGVMGLFTGGLLLAGLTAVDSGLVVTNAAKSLASRITGNRPDLAEAESGEPIWFLGTMFVGPAAFIVDHIHQTQFKIRTVATLGNEQHILLRTPRPDEARAPDGSSMRGVAPYTRSLGRVAEIGTLYCTVAGMLNLIAIIDAAYAHRRPRRVLLPAPAPVTSGSAA